VKGIQTVIVVLGLPVTVGPLILRATTIVDAMAKNPKTFPSPTPPLAKVRTDIAGLATAEAAHKNRMDTISPRELMRKLVAADMHQLHAYVQTLASASPEQADVIASLAAMTVRKTGARHKADLAVRALFSGSVRIIAKAIQGGRAYEWQLSLDGGKTWTSLPPTTKASTTVNDLQPGVMTHFRNRVITKAGPSDWSKAVSMIVS